MQQPIYNETQLKEDYDFVLKKLGLSAEEFQKIMANPPVSHYAFDYEKPLDIRYPVLKPIKKIYRAIKPVKKRGETKL